MSTADPRLTLQLHPRARRTVEHPMRQFYRTDVALLVPLNLHRVNSLLLQRPNQRHPLPKPRMPAITHLQLSTVSIAWCGCIATNAPTRVWRTRPPGTPSNPLVADPAETI